jgi:pimeloyl-ACP methyl ester carboxylesterase
LTYGTDQRHEAHLDSGSIGYRDVGQGRTLVLVHGYMANSRLWDGVVKELATRYRCVVPDWPLGSHTVAMNADADLSPPGIASLIDDFLRALELENVTLVGNDSGGAMAQVFVSRCPERIERLVLTNCDSHENFPPGIFQALPSIAKLPGGGKLLVAPHRFGAISRAIFKPLVHFPIPDDLLKSWVGPSLKNAAIRRDLKKVTMG